MFLTQTFSHEGLGLVVELNDSEASVAEPGPVAGNWSFGVIFKRL